MEIMEDEMKNSTKEYWISKIVGDMPIMMNMHINGKGIKKGWAAYGPDKDKCIISPIDPGATIKSDKE